MPYLETAGSGEDDNGEDDFGSDIPYDDELEEALRKAETNAAVVDIEDAVAISPLEQFKRGNYLSVSDLVGTVWCEVQYDYRLRTLPFLPVDKRPTVITSKHGAEIAVDKAKVEGKERILRRGEKIHKRLEREIHPETVVVKTETREDAWGLRIINMLASLEALLTLGVCREMHVAGFVDDVFVLGIIDEISRVAMDGIDSGPDSKHSSPARTRSTRQSSLAEYFGGPRARTHRLRVSDNKTRAHATVPQEKDSLSGRLQVMVYKELLDALLVPRSEPVAATEDGGTTPASLLPTDNASGLSSLFARLGLDENAQFTEKFLLDTRLVVIGNDLRWGAGEARTLAEFVPVWDRYVVALGLGTPPTHGGKAGDGITDESLQLVYRRAAGKRREKGASDRRKRRKGKRREVDAEVPADSGTESEPENGPKAGLVDDLQLAIQRSLMDVAGGAGSGTAHSQPDTEDADLQRAIKMSLEESAQPIEVDDEGQVVASTAEPEAQSLSGSPVDEPAQQSDAAEVASCSQTVPVEPPIDSSTVGGTEDADLQRALQLSLQVNTPPGEPSGDGLVVPLNTRSTRARPASRVSFSGDTDSEREREDDQLAWAIELSMGTQPEPAVVEVPLLRLSQEAASGSQPPQTPSKGKAKSSSEPPSPKSPSKPKEDTDKDKDKEDKKKLSEKSGGIIGTITFSHDRVYLADHLRSVLGYWKGERAPQGVGPADTKRCEWCEFEEGCEWRIAKAQEHRMRYFASRNNSMAM